MGFRTVVILHNDRVNEWENDPTLGKKISHAMNFAYPMYNTTHGSPDFGTGSVIQSVHADCRNLVMFDSYRAVHIAFNHWTPSDQELGDLEIALPLIREAAAALGYTLTKMRKKP